MDNPNKSQTIRFAQKGLVLNESCDSLLLIKYGSSKYTAPKVVNKLALPGGKLSQNETLEESFIREVKEETGVLMNPHMPVYSFSFLVEKPQETIQIVLTVRLAMYVSGIPITCAEEAETTISNVAWHKIQSIDLDTVVFDEAPAIQLLRDNVNLFTKILGIPYLKYTQGL